MDQGAGNSLSSSHEGDSPFKLDKPNDEIISSDWKEDPFIEFLGTSYECTICKTFLNSVNQVRCHIRGAKHLKAKGTFGNKLDGFPSANQSMDQIGGNSLSSFVGDSSFKFDKPSDEVISSDREQEPFIVWVGKEYKCTICKTSLNSVDQVSSHIRGAKHLKAKSKLDEFSSANRCIDGIDGTASSSHIGDSTFKIRNHIDEAKELILNIKVFNPNDEISF